MIKRIILLVAFALLAFPSLAIAGTDDGIIAGKVVNGTSGGGSVANLTVNLISHADQNDPGITATTDADGNFSFAGLSTENSYIVYLYYHNVVYVSSVSFDQDTTSTSTEITVYETTTSDSAIKSPIYNIVIAAQENDLNKKATDLKIVEQINFLNEGDTTYVGSEEISEGVKRTLSVSLPKEASEVTVFVNGQIPLDSQIYYTEEGFAYTEPLSPGVENITQIYLIYWVKDISETSFTFSKALYYPTTVFNLFVMDTGIEVTSDQLTTEEPFDYQGTLYFHLSGKELNTDITLQSVISGLPKANTFGPHKWIGVILLVLTCVLGIGYILKRNYHHFKVLSYANNLEQDKERLLQEIARLDDDFEEGGISPEMHEKMRSAKKMQLIELINKLEDRGNGE